MEEKVVSFRIVPDEGDPACQKLCRPTDNRTRVDNRNAFQTNVGPILVCINPYTDVGNPLTLTSTRAVPLAPQLNKVVQEAVRQQSETGYPQAIILSGK